MKTLFSKLKFDHLRKSISIALINNLHLILVYPKKNRKNISKVYSIQSVSIFKISRSLTNQQEKEHSNRKICKDYRGGIHEYK